MVESLASVLLITIIFVVILLVIIPELWRWLSRQNREKFRRLSATIPDTNQAIEETRSKLRPYQNLQVQDFSRIYEAGSNQLKRARDRCEAATQRLRTSTLTSVRADAWALPFFLAYPQHFTSIPHDTLRLWEAQRMLNQARSAIKTAQKKHTELERLPQVLQRRIKQLTERLKDLQTALDVERGEGITAWADLATSLNGLEQNVQVSAQQWNPNLTPAQVDQLAKELGQLDHGIQQLEQDVKAARQARTTLDKQLQETKAKRDKLETTQGDPHNQLTPLLVSIDGLLDKTKGLRQQRAFTEAENHLITVDLLLDLTQALQATLPHVQYLDSVQPIPNLSEEIQTTLSEWEQILHHVHALAQQPEVENHETINWLISEAHSLQARMRDARKEYTSAVSELEREAEREVNRLRGAWQSLQRTHPLANDDPLARTYEEHLQQWEEARGYPLSLQTFIADAATLREQIEEIETYLRDAFQGVDNRLRELPALVTNAQQEAGDWRCLQRQSEAIREDTARLRQMWQERREGLLDEVYALLTDIDQLVEQIWQTYDQMSQQRAELIEVDGEIQKTLAIIEQNPSGIDAAKMVRLMTRIEQNYESARRVDDCGKALSFLNEGYEHATVLLNS